MAASNGIAVAMRTVDDEGAYHMGDSEKGTVKTSLTLTKEELDTLRKLAAQLGVSVAEVLRSAIAEEAFLRDVVDEDGRVLLEAKDKSLKELVIQ